MKNRITLKNIVFSIIMQISLIISGIIIPRLIIGTFGSEINGLVSSITQCLNFISFLEGGLTGVVMASLYKPLLKNDQNRIGAILNTTNSFYKKISIIFIVYSSILAIVYSCIYSNQYSFLYLSTLVLSISFGIYIQYCFSFALKTFLNADKKGYIVYITQSIIIMLNLILTVFVLTLYPNIHVIKVLESILFVIQPIAFNRFVKKHYDINYDMKKDNNLLKNRWSGFAINMSAYVHGNTDIVVLTIFSSFSIISVYTVYYMVVAALKKIVISVSSAMQSTIGRIYISNNKSDMNIKFGCYEYITFTLVFFLFTVALIMITPFVLIYTNDINDVNYNQPLFGYFLVISELIYLIREPYATVAYSANKFKELSKIAYFEAFLNIILSVFLVKKIGLIGVSVGTCIAMFVRTTWQILYTNRLLKRKNLVCFKKLLIFIMTGIIGIVLCSFIPLNNDCLLGWVISAFIVSSIMIVLLMIVSFLFYKNEFTFIKNYLLKGAK